MKGLLTGSGMGKLYLVLFGIVILLGASGAGAASYRLTDMGNLGPVKSGYCMPTSINRQGDVAGWASVNSASQRHAFLWKNGVMTDLGTLGSHIDSEANRINNAGQVLVNATGSDGKARGFIWQNGVWTDLGLLPGGDACAPLALNNLGQVVGHASIHVTIGNIQYMGGTAFLWQNGVLQDLNQQIPPDSGIYLNAAGAINDLGQITATYNIPDVFSEGRAVLLTPITKAALGPMMLLLQ